MNTLVKQVAAIDSSKEENVARIKALMSDQSSHVISSRCFANTTQGAHKLRKWVIKHTSPDVVVEYVVEATGVYHQALAHYLFDQQELISVVLPNKISGYAKSLNLKTINDMTASDCIAEFGLRHKLVYWQKPDELLITLRDLMREREALIGQRTVVKNELHAVKHSVIANNSTINRLQKRIKFYNSQIDQIEEEAKQLVEGDQELHQSIKYLCTIPGIGKITAYTVVGETLGFNQFTSYRQLVSYAGLDVKTKESGTSVKSKPKISKRGNKHIRKALYFPAFSAIKHNPKAKNTYARLVGKHGVKMKAAVAVQRKLLVLMYTLWKKQEVFNPEI